MTSTQRSASAAVGASTVGNGRQRLSHREQVKELISAVQRLSLARSVPEVQAIVRRTARRLAGADGATFILRAGDKCFYADEDAVAPLWKGQRFPLERCISGWVMLNRQSVVIDDIYQDNRIPHDAYRPTFVKSLAMVPIRTVDPVGAIGNYWAVPHRASDEEVELLQALADSTAVALENVRAYEELERRAHATAAFTFVSDGVLLTDERGIIRSCNPVAQRISGKAEHEIVGKKLEEAIPGWDEIAERIPVAPAEAERPPRRETLPLRIGELEVWLSICGTSFPEGTVYTFADVTDELALERMRSELIATVSHELRTPLSSIFGAAATLRREDVELDASTRADLLAMIESQAGNLNAILEEILLASRLEAGKEAVTTERADPVDLAREVVESMRTANPHARIALVEPDSSGGVVLDAQKTSQVLRNLIENAIRYSGEPCRVAVAVTTDGQRVCFAVRDHGVGIPPEEQERIFEKFYRVDAAKTNGAGGTGLGLYICRELVQRMNGRIWVDSTPGRGSTFTFELPIR